MKKEDDADVFRIIYQMYEQEECWKLLFFAFEIIPHIYDNVDEHIKQRIDENTLPIPCTTKESKNNTKRVCGINHVIKYNDRQDDRQDLLDITSYCHCQGTRLFVGCEADDIQTECDDAIQ